jgi:hypothetical protein
MIHAQRPDAIACAEYDFWNRQWGRYVKRGSKGIALIDTSGDTPRLRYVFDVSDTRKTEKSREVRLWQLRQEHISLVSDMLEHRYNISGERGLPYQLEHVAAQLADEYWNMNQYDILDILANSFLEEYDSFNAGVQFRKAATASSTYSLMSRCGFEPQTFFTHEDFLSIFDFNTPAAINALGTAVSQINQQILREIEVAIRNYEREKLAERSHENDRTDLHPERRLPDTQPDADESSVETLRQIREDEKELPSGTSPDIMEQPDSFGETVPSSSEIDETARRRLEQMMPELMELNGVTEELKARDQMKWVGLMNNLKAQAEETILNELVYN